MNILVVDDHPLIQEALAQILVKLDRSIAVWRAHNRHEALGTLDGHAACDLILLDLHIPGASGFSLLQELRDGYPDVPVVVLSATCDRSTVVSALDMGAMGFIPKTASPQVLLSALQVVLSGSVYLPKEILAHDDEVKPSPGDLNLTPRQYDVLALLVQGKPNKLICRELNLAEGTVKVHISAILKSLNVNSRTQAVIAVGRLGIRLRAPKGPA